MLKLFDKYGKDTVLDAMDELMNYSERRVRHNIDEIPDGIYQADNYMDDDGVTDEPAKIHVKVKIDGSDVFVDFTGTDKQRKGAINSPVSASQSAVYGAIRYFCDPDIPQNDGCYKPIEIVTPEGTLVNPKHPAACVARVGIYYRIVEGIFKALSEVLPNKVGTASYGTSPVYSISGIDTRTGDYFIHLDAVHGSWGARAYTDGNDGLCYFLNPGNQTIEDMEERHPYLLFQYWGFVTDSGGPGKYRGGLATKRVVKFLVPEGVLAVRSSRVKLAPWGLSGGKPGAKSELILNPRTEEEKRLGSKVSMIPIKNGDVLSFTCAGAGGYGNPFERDPEAVRRDVIEGKVSIKSARRDYGVSIKPNTLALDHPARIGTFKAKEKS